MLPIFLKPLNVRRSNLIRIGPKKDGGYIIDKRILGKSQILISCGLNDDWEFEKDFLKKNGVIAIKAYDHTVNNNIGLKDLKKTSFHFYYLKNKIK